MRLKRATASLTAGQGAVALSARRLRPGRYRAVVVATDAAGNHSVPRTVQFRVRRR